MSFIIRNIHSETPGCQCKQTQIKEVLNLAQQKTDRNKITYFYFSIFFVCKQSQVSMAEKITATSDLTLPLAVIQRLIKEALPPNAIAKNEAKLGVAKAASVFILFLTSGIFF